MTFVSLAGARERLFKLLCQCQIISVDKLLWDFYSVSLKLE